MSFQMRWNDLLGFTQLLVMFGVLARYPVVVPGQEFSLCRGTQWKYFGVEVDWLSAKSSCAASGAHLAVPKSGEDLQCILDTLPASRPAQLRVWVGATDRLREGFYTWVTGLSLSAASPLWREWEPSDHTTDDDDEDCVYSYPDEGGKLGDRACGNSHVYVCQKQLLLPTTFAETSPMLPRSSSTPPPSTTAVRTSYQVLDTSTATQVHMRTDDGIRIAPSMTSRTTSGTTLIAATMSHANITGVEKAFPQTTRGTTIVLETQSAPPKAQPTVLPATVSSPVTERTESTALIGVLGDSTEAIDEIIGDSTADTSPSFTHGQTSKVSLSSLAPAISTGREPTEISPDDRTLGNIVRTKIRSPDTSGAVSGNSSDGVLIPIVIGLVAAFALILLIIVVVLRRRMRAVLKIVVAQSHTGQDAENGGSEKTPQTFNNMSYNSLTLQQARSAASLKPVNDYEDVLGQSMRRDHGYGTIYRNEYYDDDEVIGYRHLFESPATTEAGIYQQLANNKYRHLVREHVIVGDQLGSGQFGDVFAGVWTTTGVEKEHVAIKTLKEGSSKDSRVKFLQEAAIMGQFHHRNVVQLYGVVAQGEPVMLVLELMRKDLRTYLLSFLTPPPDVEQLFIRMAQDIASGMAYLGAKGFVHRDLAARNVMIDTENVCKIGDFGMSRDLAHEDCYVSHGGKVPVKWTAPEAISFRQYSTASDVWSYGIVLYEIYEFGRKPYAFWSNEKVLSEVKAGYRLPKPKNCPPKLYSMMMHCWLLDKSARPTFLQILQELDQFKDCSIPSQGSSV